MYAFSYVVEQQLVIFLYVLILLMEQTFFFLIFYWPEILFGKPRMFMYSIFSHQNFNFFGLGLTVYNRKSRMPVV